jgi:hypothetical protein
MRSTVHVPSVAATAVYGARISVWPTVSNPMTAVSL